MASGKAWGESWKYGEPEDDWADRRVRTKLWAENHKSNNSEDRQKAIRSRARAADKGKKK